MSGASRYYLKGAWSACCDTCGELFKSTMMTRQWDGFMVCFRCLDYRNAQELIKAPQPQRPIPWMRSCGNGCTCASCQAANRVLDSNSSDRISLG